MFEGKLPQHGAFRPLDDEQTEGERLRSLDWDDLVARLSAARELRSALTRPSGATAGSFDAGSARRIAAHLNGKQVVNFDDLSNGKGAERRASRAGPGSEPEAPAAPRGST